MIEVSIRVLLLVELLLKSAVWALTVRPKGLGRLVQIEEKVTDMSKVFVYIQSLLTPPAGVDKQRFIVTVDGVAQEAQLVPASTTSVSFEAGPEGAIVGRTLDYLDAAGNDSANYEAEPFAVTDTIPPAGPTGLGDLVQVDEKEIPDAPPVE